MAPSTRSQVSVNVAWSRYVFPERLFVIVPKKFALFDSLVPDAG